MRTEGSDQVGLWEKVRGFTKETQELFLKGGAIFAGGGGQGEGACVGSRAPRVPGAGLVRSLALRSDWGRAWQAPLPLPSSRPSNDFLVTVEFSGK